MTINFKFTILFYFIFIFPLKSQNKAKEIDQLLTPLFESAKINGNFLVAENGKIIYNKSFGLANELSKEKLKKQSVFELASCTKPFTAMAISILKENGKLNLADNIIKYFPELPGYENISILNLIHHTSGLPDYFPLMDSLWDKSKIATNQDVIDLFSIYKPEALFTPNTKHEYSNTGYVLLATLIERVSGQSYAEFLEENVFHPLKMKNSLVYRRRYAPQKVKNYALGYLYLKTENKLILPDDYGKTSMVFWLDGIVGDGTVNSTVLDLFKWDRALYSTKLVSQESMAEIFSNGILNDGTIGKHGFGWRIMDTPEYGTIVRHSGGWPGYLSYIERDIDHDKTIIILQNHYNSVIPSDEIRAILYK